MPREYCKKLRAMKIKSILALTVFLFLIKDAYPAVNKVIRITSVPNGANVYLLQGKKQTLIGVTPFDYRAEFHSNISILRLKVSKVGYNSTPARLSAKNDVFNIRLSTTSYAAAANTVKNTQLRGIQKRLTPVIDRVLPALIMKSGINNDDLGLLKVTKIGDKTILVVPLKLSKNKITSNVQRKTSDFVNEVWKKIGSALINPLTAKTQNEAKLDGILLAINYSNAENKFQVAHRQESKVEMQCQGGYVQKNEWTPCARTVQVYENHYDINGRFSRRPKGTRCEGGMVTRSVYEQCASKVPVTTYSIKTSPSMTLNKNTYRLQYLHLFDRNNPEKTKKISLQELGVLCTNSSGKILIEKGNNASFLSRNKTSR